MQLSFALDSHFLRAAIHKHVKALSNWFEISVVDTIDKKNGRNIPLSSVAMVEGNEITLVASNLWSLKEAKNALIVAVSRQFQPSKEPVDIEEWLRSFEFDPGVYSKSGREYFLELISQIPLPSDEIHPVAQPQLSIVQEASSRLENRLRDLAPTSEAQRNVLESVLENQPFIQDFGEHIPMARKHVYELAKILEDIEQNKDKSDYAKSLAGKLTKNVIWEKPNTIDMVNVHKYEPFAAFTINEIYSSIIANPRFKRNEEAPIYIHEILRLKELLMDSKTELEIRDVGRKYFKPLKTNPEENYLSREGKERIRVIGGQKVLNSLSITRVMESRAKAAISEGWPQKQPVWKRGYRYEKIEDGKYDIYKGNLRSRHGPFLAEVDADVHLKSLHYSKSLEIRPDKLDPDLQAIYRRLSSAGAYRYLKGGFVDTLEAKEYLRDFSEELFNQKPPHIIRPELADVYRQGPSKRGMSNIDTSDFSKTFAVRGGQFGNWNNNQDRQGFLNDCYDAYLDLARTLDIPERAIGLGGRLAMAFGARGKSGAKAHYEPRFEVINLNKRNGAGSLAHEWFHALDNRLGRIASGGEGLFVTKNSRAAGNLPNEIQVNLNSLMRSLHYRKATTEEASLYVKDNISKLERIVHKLGAVFRKGLGDEEVDRPKLQKITGNLSQIAKGEPGKLEFENGIRSYSKINKLLEIYNEKNDPKSISVQLDALVNQAENVREQFALLNDYKSGSKTVEIKTDFFKDALQLDSSRSKDYWSTKVEMAARAFETYVYERMDSNGQYNQFLVNGVSEQENDEFRKMFANSAYPSGEDRKSINLCFDRLIDSLKPMFKEQLTPKIDEIPIVKSVVDKKIENKEKRLESVRSSVSL